MCLTKRNFQFYNIGLGVKILFLNTVFRIVLISLFKSARERNECFLASAWSVWRSK
jgi:hypothetical protein